MEQRADDPSEIEKQGPQLNIKTNAFHPGTIVPTYRAGRVNISRGKQMSEGREQMTVSRKQVTENR